MSTSNASLTAEREPAIPGRYVVDPAGWGAIDMSARSDWIHLLGGAELRDLEVMSRRVRRRIGDEANALLNLSDDAFDLGEFGDTLAQIRSQLADGRGFAVIRGFPVDDWDRIDTAIVYWGLGRHIGRAVSNNPEGDMIGHVTDLGKDYNDPRHRGYQTRAGMSFHADQCDLVSLLCLRTAMSGGTSVLASSVAVHNEMLRRRPDLVDELTQPFYWSRHEEVGAGQNRWYTSPVFAFADGYLCSVGGGKHVEKGHALPEVPDLTQRQREALAMFNTVAEELKITMEFRPGDIQILNNQVMLHTRTAYEDWPDPACKRLLWRLWFNAPDIRPRSPYFEYWHDGVRTPGTRERIVL